MQFYTDYTPLFNMQLGLDC